MSVEVFAADEQEAEPVDVARWAEMAKKVLAAEGIAGDAEMTLLFVDDLTIADLNKRFMGKEGPTDVLSFPIDEDLRPEGRMPDAGTSGPTADDEAEIPALLGDVLICPAVAAKNAPEHAGTYEDELALLIVHGILHLLGMDHEEDVEAEIMEAREKELLEEFYGRIPKSHRSIH